MNKAPILIAAFILGSFAVGGVGLVAVTHAMTDTRIAENQREAMLAKLKAIVPAERVKNDPLDRPHPGQRSEACSARQTEVYRVRDGDAGGGVLQPVVPDGYAGPIRLLVSVLATAPRRRAGARAPRDPGPRRQDRREKGRLDHRAVQRQVPG
jgi:electron transport complex protein RnfG